MHKATCFREGIDMHKSTRLKKLDMHKSTCFREARYAQEYMFLEKSDNRYAQEYMFQRS